MTPDQVNAFVQRFVEAIEQSARALEGLYETHRRELEKRYPEKREVRQAVTTRVPSPEDRIREGQGASNKPIDEWLSDIEEQKEDIGPREREWLERQNEQKRNAGA